MIFHCITTLREIDYLPVPFSVIVTLPVLGGLSVMAKLPGAAAPFAVGLKVTTMGGAVPPGWIVTLPALLE